jgi:hypothetical protein
MDKSSSFVLRVVIYQFIRLTYSLKEIIKGPLKKSFLTTKSTKKAQSTQRENNVFHSNSSQELSERNFVTFVVNGFQFFQQPL